VEAVKVSPDEIGGSKAFVFGQDHRMKRIEEARIRTGSQDEEDEVQVGRNVGRGRRGRGLE